MLVCNSKFAIILPLGEQSSLAIRGTVGQEKNCELIGLLIRHTILSILYGIVCFVTKQCNHIDGLLVAPSVIQGNINVILDKWREHIPPESHRSSGTLDITNDYCWSLDFHHYKSIVKQTNKQTVH